jgi:hypothetical protein
MVNFKKFLNEASMEEYGDLLDDVVSLLDATGGQQVWVKNGGNKVIITISGENYVESDMNGDVIKTQKIYKDGEVTNYDLAISRLKALKSAIENEQFVEQKGE